MYEIGVVAVGCRILKVSSFNGAESRSSYEIPTGDTGTFSNCDIRVVLRKTLKNKYSRNETILKIGHHAKPIAFAKSSLWVKN